MDVLFFLKERTRLIRQYYEHAAHPFNEIIRKIEAESARIPAGQSTEPNRAVNQVLFGRLQNNFARVSEA